jgi:hypothetical protein
LYNNVPDVIYYLGQREAKNWKKLALRGKLNRAEYQVT